MNISGLLLAFAFFLLLAQATNAQPMVICHKYKIYHGYRHYYCCHRFYQHYRDHYPLRCYPRYNANIDGELDNACVDACLGLTNTLNHCMRSCYF